MTKHELRAAIRRKQRLGLLPPQTCANPRCRADLADPSVPPEYAEYRLMFGLAREVAVNEKVAVWVCPVCGHRWRKHRRVT